MRLWVFKRHFSTIFQLYIDLCATFPGANMVQGINTLGYLYTRHSTYRKESTLTNTQNVWHVHLEKCKQNLEISTLTSEQIVGLRECWLSNLSDISLEWVVHFGRNMSDLRVWSLNHLECTVFSLPEPTWIVCLVFKQYSFHKEGLAPWSSLDLAFPLLCFEYTHRTLSLLHLVPNILCFWYIFRFNESLSMVTIPLCTR